MTVRSNPSDSFQQLLVLALDDEQGRRLAAAIELGGDDDAAAGEPVEQFGPRGAEFFFVVSEQLDRSPGVARLKRFADGGELAELAERLGGDDSFDELARRIDAEGEVGLSRHEAERIVGGPGAAEQARTARAASETDGTHGRPPGKLRTELLSAIVPDWRARCFRYCPFILPPDG